MAATKPNTEMRSTLCLQDGSLTARTRVKFRMWRALKDACCSSGTVWAMTFRTADGPQNVVWIESCVHFTSAVQNHHVYSCCTAVRSWYVTWRNGPWLRAFEHRLLREIFGPKRGGVKRDGRKLYNEEGDPWFRPPPKSILVMKSDNETGWACGIYRGKRNVDRGLVVNLKRRSYWKTLE